MRDSSLPLGYRLNALGACIEMSGPLGFNATWSYLETRIGLPRRSIEFLVPAIDLLEAARRSRRDIEASYTRLRRAQKRAGLRSPRQQDITPWSPPRWHGDERAGAVHELTAWLGRRTADELLRHPRGADVIAAARIATQPMPPLDLDRLQVTLDWARHQTKTVDWTQDHTEYRLAWVMLFLLGQIYIVVHDQPAVGAQWNFVGSPVERAGVGSVARCLLADPVGLWRTSPREGTPELIAAATDLLVLGFDGPAVRTLAGMSAGDSQYEVEPVVADILEQLDARQLLEPSRERAGLEARLVKFLDGDLALRELSGWAHTVIGHDGDADCHPFVNLDDIYDDWENAGHDLGFLEEVTRRAANTFLAGQQATQLDRLEPPGWQPLRDETSVEPTRWRDLFRRRWRPTS